MGTAACTPGERPLPGTAPEAKTKHLYKKVVCDSVCLCVCLSPHISVSYSCTGLTSCRALGDAFLSLYAKKISPGVGILHMWMFDIDYVT